MQTAVVKGVVNPFSGGRWIMEPKPQNIWGKPHATWFMCMGVGAALFTNRALFGFEMGRVLGISVAEWLSLIIIGIGGFILIADLGKPLRFWKVYRNLRTSWITRGFLADMVFVALAGLLALPDLELGGLRPFAGLPWGWETPLGLVFQVIALAACVVIVIYPGLVLASSAAIPFWNSMLIPLQYLAFGSSSALGLAFAAAAVGLGAPPGREWLLALAALYLLGLGLLLLHLQEGQYRHPAARVSVTRLLRGDVQGDFLWGTLGLGVLAPLALVAAALLAPGAALPMAAVAGLIGLLGNWYSKLAVIRAGTFAPFL